MADAYLPLNNIDQTTSALDAAFVSSELKRSGYSPDQINLGIEYFLANLVKCAAAASPIGFIRNAIDKGYAGDAIIRAKEKTAVANKAASEEEYILDNRAIGKEIAKQCDGPGCEVRADDYSISFWFKACKKPGGRSISFKDPNFQTLITQAKKVADDNNNAFRKTHTMETIRPEKDDAL